jgi:hypothetical protein
MPGFSRNNSYRRPAFDPHHPCYLSKQSLNQLESKNLIEDYFIVLQNLNGILFLNDTLIISAIFQMLFLLCNLSELTGITGPGTTVAVIL